MWHPPLQQQPEEIRHNQPPIVKTHITDIKFPTFRVKGSFVAPWCGQQTVAHTQQSPEPYNMQQTLQRASTGGSMQSKWPSADEEQP